jgi:hypothetical protein
VAQGRDAFAGAEALRRDHPAGGGDGGLTCSKATLDMASPHGSARSMPYHPRL